MIERYFYIPAEKARELIETARKMDYSSRGIDRRTCLIGDYAVLRTERLKLRNVDTRDDDLRYFDEIVEALWQMHEQGMGVVPILGYCHEEDGRDGSGYIIERRAAGRELYDDAIMTRFCVWSQGKKNLYISCKLSDAEAAAYLADRTHEIACAPQEHFDKLVSDMKAVLDRDILIDCMGKSNFFYDSDTGFQMIDLDAHNDYRYGLSESRPDMERYLIGCALVPCHQAGSSPNALDDRALAILTGEQMIRLRTDNLTIFGKCRAALLKDGISEEKIDAVLKTYCVFGA